MQLEDIDVSWRNEMLSSLLTTDLYVVRDGSPSGVELSLWFWCRVKIEVSVVFEGESLFVLGFEFSLWVWCRVKIEMSVVSEAAWLSVPCFQFSHWVADGTSGTTWRSSIQIESTASSKADQRHSCELLAKKRMKRDIMRTTSKNCSFGELGGGAGTSKRLVLTGRVAGMFEMKNVNEAGLSLCRIILRRRSSLFR